MEQTLGRPVVLTYKGTIMPPTVLGILYLCRYDWSTRTIEIMNSLSFDNPSMALNAYANIPNPESLLAVGGTREEFEEELKKLHANLDNPEWVREMGDYL